MQYVSCEQSARCQETYAWVSVAIYASAVWSFVASLKDPYAIAGWSLATAFTAAYATALRSERLGGTGTSGLRGHKPLLLCAAAGPLVYTVWCFATAIRVGDTLAPPYDKNHWLGGIASNVASVWAVRLAFWAGTKVEAQVLREQVRQAQDEAGQNDRTANLLAGVQDLA